MSQVFSAKSAKAFTAATLAGLSAMAVVVAGDGSIGLADLTLAQWLTVAIAIVGSFAATYNIPNGSAPVPVRVPGDNEATVLTTAQVDEIVAARLAHPTTMPDWETKQQ